MHEQHQLNQIPIMITQIKQRKKQTQKFTSLQISPKIQIKLQLSRLINKQFTTLYSQKQQEIDTINQQQTIQMPSDRQLKKYIESASPQPSMRRKVRLSSYQLYKEQRSLKSSHKNRVSEWKARFQSLRREKDKKKKSINSFNRTNSFSQGRNRDKQIQLRSIRDEIVEFGQEQCFRSTYIKTTQGKRRMVDNHQYLKKLKSKIQFYSLSAIINNHQAAVNAISPCIKALQPKQFEFNHKKSQKPIVKYGKASKFRSKVQGKSQVQCRPWSGFKEEFGSDLGAYL